MRNNLIKISVIVLLIVVVVLAWSGCGSSKATPTPSMTPTPTTTPTSPTTSTPIPTTSIPATPTPTPTVEAIEPDYAGPITEEILQAFNSGDYLAYSRHFDQTMLQAATEAGFQKSREQVQAAYGDYISKTFEELQENLQGVYTVVVYKAQFSKQADVEVQVVFQMIGDTVFVSGLWMK